MADPGGGGGGGGRAPGARAPPFRSSNYIFIVAQYNVLNCNLKLQQQKKRPRFAREQWRIHGGGEGGGGGGGDVQTHEQQKSEFSFNKAALESIADCLVYCAG